MRTTLVCLTVVLLSAPNLDAAPAPETGRAAKEKLEALKKKLPEILDEWKKTRVGNLEDEQANRLNREVVVLRGGDEKAKLGKPELRVIRRVGPERAKVVVLFPYYDSTGERKLIKDEMLTIYLSYQDGCWTTERSDSFNNEFFNSKDASFLMLAIDEAAEK